LQQDLFCRWIWKEKTIKGVLLEKAIIQSGDIVFEAFNQSNTDLRVVLGIEACLPPPKMAAFLWKKQ
jgi:hypothetical protein